MAHTPSRGARGATPLQPLETLAIVEVEPATFAATSRYSRYAADDQNHTDTMIRFAGNRLCTGIVFPVKRENRAKCVRFTQETQDGGWKGA